MAESDLSIPHREAQRADDMALLSEVRNDLPQGHRELPGLIRAIELLRVSPHLGGRDVAVDSDALVRVREAYEHNIAVRDVGPEPGGLTKMLTAHEALRDAVACLLGLEDR